MIKTLKYILILAIIISVNGKSYAQNKENDIYQKAYAYFLNKKYTEAINLLNEKNIPNFKQDKYLLIKANSYFALKNYEKATEIYKKALKLKNNESALKIAECRAMLNQPYKATEYLKIYLKTPGKKLPSEIKLIPAFKNISNDKAWTELWKTNRYNTYEKKLDEAKYMISTENYAEAFDILDKLIIKNRKRHKAFEIRADLLMLTKEYQNAANSYIKASQIKTKNLTYKTKAANALYLAKKYKKAEKLYDQITENPFYNPEILLNKAKNEIKLKKYDKAEQNINKFTKYFPGNAEANFIKGKIKFTENDYINALENFNKAIKKDNSNPQYFIYAADAYLKTKTFEQAEKNYLMALDLNPKMPEVWFKKGITEIKLYKYKEGCMSLKKAKSMNYHKADDYIIKYCK